MEQLKLSFETEAGGERQIYIVEVQYREGIVATSEFCPTELLAVYSVDWDEGRDRFLDVTLEDY